MKTGFRYSLLQKTLFILSYFFYKLILPLETARPRWKLWVYEWIYSLKNLLDRLKGNRFPPSYLYPFRETVIRTRFGEYRVRPRTSDAANVSPAFERRDVNALLRLLDRLRRRDQKVLFLDIGADLGTYSVTVAGLHPSVTVWCFEPIPDSVRLLRENLRRNALENRVRVFPCALSDRNGVAVIRCVPSMPGSSSAASGNRNKALPQKEIRIHTRTLDSLAVRLAASYDAVVMKIDVEGMERKVLAGARKILKSGRAVYLLVEDFVQPAIISWLVKAGAEFLGKFTDYNSWWALGARKK